MNKIKVVKNKIVRHFRKLPKEKIEQLYQEKAKEWIDKPGIIGIAHDGKRLIVYQDKNTMIANTVNEYSDSDVKIIKIEPFTFLLNDSDDYKSQVIRTNRVRPIFGGISVGHKDVTAGTLSLIVRDKITKEPLILSNNHVLANLNHGKIGDAILQPGAADGGTIADKVGELERFIPLANNVTVDCAVAKPTVDVKKWNEILGLEDVWFIADPAVGQTVIKSGRTSGVTSGTIKQVNATIKVNYGNKDYVFTDVVISDIKSSPGDSGSAIIEKYKAKLVGLLFAGNGSLTVLCKATNVFEQLGIELMPHPPLILDLSHYNGTLTDSMVQDMYKKGVRGLFLKASEGGSYKDDQFANSVEVCRRNGMLWSPYHFCRANISANIQYNNFISAIGDNVPDFQPMIDIETTDEQSPEKITSVALKLLELVDAHFSGQGYNPPWIYTRGSFANAYFLPSDKWAKYPLMVARWYTDNWDYSEGSYVDPYFPKQWKSVGAKLWQNKADKDGLGAYFGLSCNDVDVSYILDEPYFDSCLVHEPPSPPPPPPPPSPPPSPPPPAEYKTGTFTWGKVTVDSLRVRTVPNTNNNSSIIYILKKDEEVEVLEEVKDNVGNTWARIGHREYAAMLYNGRRYIEYIPVN